MKALELFIVLTGVSALKWTKLCNDETCDVFTSEDTSKDPIFKFFNGSDSGPAFINIKNCEVKYTETGSNGGNFLIDRDCDTQIPLDKFFIEECGGENMCFRFTNELISKNDVNLILGDNIKIRMEYLDSAYNAISLRLHQNSRREIFGGGEQYNYVNLVGHDFDMFVNEQGVGRGDTLDQGCIIHLIRMIYHKMVLGGVFLDIDLNYFGFEKKNDFFILKVQSFVGLLRSV